MAFFPFLFRRFYSGWLVSSTFALLGGSHLQRGLVALGCSGQIVSPPGAGCHLWSPATARMERSLFSDGIEGSCMFACLHVEGPRL
ncbi:hypothetical protein EDB80DRAFT_106086 [Ilyonectria destructans]|nr:hypothetical protein EDB80DRAFT_106086 [Ilyonectria destructans]